MKGKSKEPIPVEVIQSQSPIPPLMQDFTGQGGLDLKMVLARELASDVTELMVSARAVIGGIGNVGAAKERIKELTQKHGPQLSVAVEGYAQETRTFQRFKRLRLEMEALEERLMDIPVDDVRSFCARNIERRNGIIDLRDTTDEDLRRAFGDDQRLIDAFGGFRGDVGWSRGFMETLEKSDKMNLQYEKDSRQERVGELWQNQMIHQLWQMDQVGEIVAELGKESPDIRGSPNIEIGDSKRDLMLLAHASLCDRSLTPQVPYGVQQYYQDYIRFHSISPERILVISRGLVEESSRSSEPFSIQKFNSIVEGRAGTK